MKSEKWTPAVSFEELDSRLENAYRRVSGTLGYEISFDSGRSRSMRDTASQMLDAGLETPGPMFLRMGRGLLEGRGIQTGPGLALRDMAAEIMREFHQEGNTAFQSVKSSLHAEALAHLKAEGLDDAHCRGILDSASAVFIEPSKAAFGRTAESFCRQKLTPLALAFTAGIAVFALVIFLLRAPHLAVIGALAGGALGFYSGRNRQRAQARALLAGLPRALYDLLRTGLRSNIERYADVVNSGAKPTR